ncbi:3-phenylpropionate/trans-cinnamate dioxygenase ferredoxin reductase subunit/anthranilate 1,2-dioxygenase ferredoxin reductase subunit [Paraburkholderia fungorum]|uniref:3-phenylpropionate/trans-cinnamate dioxygenase ferredoxin reductase subunit/anthranilate 1,2-dioxygenase ferredoxin reductase subunit n=1 Tax=Paraburkholderia fungorum TaxID=134537 RepID=A0A1H1JFP2_9BURK|nr:anthranilate 1,2-dioxygenase system ferredoxin--NAD(+) reductase [Paraburkholderia fungorum]SDR48745.1 3-phenylpropionate/trans-cinnamate dioxygenase ferredoxin reductase subunit/anthranilate 1,2-dioxygenase ferredoxin reductase subunit [Paraburkholderia fungorum]
MSTDRHVIVGAGHAARRAAETLRARDPGAHIVMIGAEPHAPYDRPILSKDALLAEGGEQKAFIRDADWYGAQDIALRLSTTVDAIDRERAVVHLHDGNEVAYDRLLLATGSRVRSFDGPVDPRVPLHYVRTLADSLALRAALAPGKQVAILGGGFIGLEVAAAVTQANCTATVIEPASVLLRRSLPHAASQFVAALHTRRGVNLWLDTTPSAIGYRNGRALIETSRGELEADIVVIGIGVLPNIELAQAAGLDVNNGIVVDEQCRTADPAIFAAGEVTQHFNPLLARSVRIESWQVAENQPAIAAANMLGDSQVYAEWPWLWSDQFDCNIQTLGMIEAEHRLMTRGNPEEGPFCVMALDEADRLRAVVAINAGREMGACKRLVAADRPLDPAGLANPAVPLRSMLIN